jgi:uncharacterized protein YggE
MNLKKQVLIVVSLCCCAVFATKGLELAFAHSETDATTGKDDQQIDRKISTSGTVTMSVMPDTIYWNISLRDRNAEVPQVKKESDEKLQRILALQKELEIGKDDMQVCHMKLSKRQESRVKGQAPVEYFEITRNVTVRQTDLSKFDEMLSAFVGVGNVEVTYRMAHANSEDVRKAVRMQALQVAQEKAASAATKLGVKLGDVRTVTDHRPAPAENSYSGVSYRAQTADVQRGVVAPSAINITASVDVTFGLQ